ncbi:MAG: DUF2793 domain-containing protein [Cypionkella sp.]
MSDPLTFPSTTPRHALPLLFAGQAQKELFVNAALALCDVLLAPAVEGETSAPPASPAEGACWLVGPAASGDFAGREGQLACRQAGQWLFVPPRDGMRVLDRPSGQHVLYRGGWRRQVAVPVPSGGATIDQEARAAIGALIGALAGSGILPGI